MVDSVEDTEPLHEGCEPDAAGYNEDQGAGVDPLNDTAQPTQEGIDPLGAVVLTKYALEKYRQLVDDEEDWLLVRGAVADELLTIPTPVAGIQARANLDAKVERANLVNVLREQAVHRGCKTRRDWADRMRGLREVGDHVFLAKCTLDIGEEEDPSLGLKPSPELLSDAGLPHPTLPSQQDVVAGGNLGVQKPQLRFAIEEVIAAYEAASG